MSPVHLDMVELEADGQRGLEQALAIFAPDQEGIVISAGILIDDTVQCRLRQCRRAYYHIVIQRRAPTCLGSLTGQFKVVGIKLLNVIGKGNVAQTDAALCVLHNNVDGQPVVAEQPAVFG